jgi:hypothetical protein
LACSHFSRGAVTKEKKNTLLARQQKKDVDGQHYLTVTGTSVLLAEVCFCLESMALSKTGSSRRDNSSLRRFTKDCDSLQRIDATSGLLATKGIF